MKFVQLTGAGLLVLMAAATPTLAADVPVKAGPAAAAAILDWTGFYAGLQAGYGWGHAKISRADENNDYTGWLAGGQLGYNVQFGSWVWGAEIDGAWTNIGYDGDPECGSPCTFLRISNLFTARLRGGPAIGNTFYYVTGGYANAALRFNDFDANIPFIAKRHHGYAVGFGAEHAFAPNWSARLEYLYVKLREEGYFIGDAIDSVGPTAHMVRAGLNYRFATGKSPGPVVTRY